MDFYCSVLVGILCVQAPIGGTTTAKMQDEGIYVSDSVDFAGAGKTWLVETGMSMERAPPRVDVKKLTQACLKEVCLAYWRNCDDALHPKKCSFILAVGSDTAQSFGVQAPNEAAMAEALSHSGVLVEKNGARAAIPFLAMDREAASTDVPYIR